MLTLFVGLWMYGVRWTIKAEQFILWVDKAHGSRLTHTDIIMAAIHSTYGCPFGSN